MLLNTRGSYGKCIICKGKHDSCECDNYTEDTTALITALSSNGFTLYDHIRYQKNFRIIFYDDFKVARFYSPYMSAVDFIIKVGKNYNDTNKVAHYIKPSGFQRRVHWNTLPVLFEYLAKVIF
jgi:hypothetical protein